MLSAEKVLTTVVTDLVTRYSRGFGFVIYSTLEDADKGITGMDAQVSYSFLFVTLLVFI
ncbi:hypothetical protein QJS10_CPB14g00258 [Acorus calamus]|uniref:RRM domain-containing protein n=1 Tax=Acorus calamus TaxID=4465 RepID=A0AAV9DD66_ACOCL|nr:hypothetical protein QJS10_CPB14g00258 [Acorus calamus]